MGVVVGAWAFRGRTPPGPVEVARAFQDGTGLETIVMHEGRTMKVVPLYLELFEPYITEHDFTLQGFAPPHRHLWENLDRVMTSLGGVRSADASTWKPDPADAALRRRWGEPSAKDRRELGLDTLEIAWRFLSGLLARGRAVK